MSLAPLEAIHQQLQAGTLVPYLGPGALAGVTDLDNGEPLPVDSDSLILAMNNGRALSPRLMYEFPRAAMHLEQRRGRAFLEFFLNRLYGERRWSRAPVHDWLAGFELPYIIDTNRDTQLLDSYAGQPHLLIVGTARVMGTDYRFVIYQSDGGDYREVTQETADWQRPVLFKPMGAPRPEPQYIASDADYVDYLTELMGGFAIPGPMKAHRRGLNYLFLGLRFLRDTERMLVTAICRDAGEPMGWAVIEEPTAKERRFCERQGITLVEAPLEAVMASETDALVV